MKNKDKCFVGKHLSMVKENNMKIKGDLFIMGQKIIHG